MNPNDPMLEVYLYENSTLIEQLENLLVEAEKSETLSDDQINETFRVMHTIKGSSAMMNFDSIALVAHSVEDLFSHIREKRPRNADWSRIFDIVLQSVDYFKIEFAKISEGQDPAAAADSLIDDINSYLNQLKSRKTPPPEERLSDYDDDESEDLFDLPGRFYKLRAFFEKDCKMENIRAFGIVNSLQNFCSKLVSVPEDLLATDADAEIVSNGFVLYMKSSSDAETLKKVVGETMFLHSFDFYNIEDGSDELPASMRKRPEDRAKAKEDAAGGDVSAPGGSPTAGEAFLKQNFISVNLSKLDKLMNLVGELVTTESMVTKNPDLHGLTLDNFEKSARQLRKLTDELQDIVMSIRMVPVSGTFHKMHRIVRDMSKKVSKDVELVLVGEETEVDKNIIDNLSDPLMHLIRNAMDHGLETAQEREDAGKSPIGRITLEARNTGGDVLIIVSDDGRGLNRQKIIEKAIANGVTSKPEAEITDREAYNFVLLPGFSTKEQVTEFSGRGVGMDVVVKNIEKVGGMVSLESTPGHGMTITIKIPLTLAIVDGMLITVANNLYILPVLTIRESFKPDMKDVIVDPDGQEMIMIRGEVYPIIRLHERFSVPGALTNFEDGIMMMIENDSFAYCLFADKLVGEQQAVVKPMPNYISKTIGKIPGMEGSSILGDGSIALILDVNTVAEQ